MNDLLPFRTKKTEHTWNKYYCSHLLGHVQKLVQVHTSVGELPEGTLLFDLCIRLEEANDSTLAT